MSDLHDTYLPLTREILATHFAPVGGTGDPERHLQYYLRSIEANAEYLRRSKRRRATPAETRRGRQLEKDERFWIVTALTRLFHHDSGVQRVELFAELLRRAGLATAAGFDSWESALTGELLLYFEVNLPSPQSYRESLKNSAKGLAIPYLLEAAEASGRHEGSTKVDAMLLAPETGTAVAFEAKVLSDVSTQITYDPTRNQLARTIDVLLDQNERLNEHLVRRSPNRSHVVLVTPEIFRGEASKSRLYGWLTPAYRSYPEDPLLGQHLNHRTPEELAGAADRLGWATWEDCNAVLPGSCAWLPQGL